MGNISCKNLEELSFEHLKILNIVLSLQQNVIRKTKKVKLRFITCKFPLRCMPAGGRPKGQRREKSRVLPLQSGFSHCRAEAQAYCPPGHKPEPGRQTF